jgi:hypothetical protein
LIRRRRAERSVRAFSGQGRRVAARSLDFHDCVSGPTALTMCAASGSAGVCRGECSLTRRRSFRGSNRPGCNSTELRTKTVHNFRTACGQGGQGTWFEHVNRARRPAPVSRASSRDQTSSPTTIASRPRGKRSTARARHSARSVSSGGDRIARRSTRTAAVAAHLR